MAEWDSIPRATVESTDVKETAKRERKWGKSFVANTARRRRSSLACKFESRNFTQQELNSCWVLFFIDSRASTCRSSGALTYLHVCSTRRADYFAYPPPSLACKCEAEHFRPMRGVRLPHGAYFEGDGLNVPLL